jgi:predicted acylesterase/phospholipase RssA
VLATAVVYVVYFRLGAATATTSAFQYATFVSHRSRNYYYSPVRQSTSLASEQPKRQGYRAKLLNLVGFRSRGNNSFGQQSGAPPKLRNNIYTLEQLEAAFRDDDHLFRRTSDGKIDYTEVVRSIRVVGDTQRTTSDHAVAQLLHERRRTHSTMTKSPPREDGAKIALVVEGGGMRGCVSAGMICAIDYLNLTSTFDVVYGSSAGSVVGAYLITGQLPWFGPEVYYDCLPTGGKDFIDSKRLMRSLGFGIVDPRLFRDVVTRPDGKPVLSLPFLLNTTLQEKKRLDWQKFKEMQKFQPLKVVASGCKSEKLVVMSMENGAFSSLEELSQAMHASALLPGLAGPIMNIDTRVFNGEKVEQKFVLGNNLEGEHYEPLADALIYGPLPYRAAIDEGATHVLTIRSRPDGTDVTGKGSVFERMIFRRFFKRKNRLPNMYERLTNHFHKKLYAENVIELNNHAYSERDYTDTSEPHLMTIALPPGSEEISRLETGRQAIFKGIRRGFARAYDCLVEDPNERGRGEVVARTMFPDEILDYDPSTIQAGEESAFAFYLKQTGIQPSIWSTQTEYANNIKYP